MILYFQLNIIPLDYKLMKDNIIPFKKRRLQRGIILSGLGNVQNEYGTVAREITHTDMLYYALYWDQITVTQIPMFYFTNDTFEQFKSNGVLDFYQNAPPNKIHSSEMQRLALESLIACLSVRKQDKSKDWLIYNNVHHSFNKIESEDLIETHALRIKIADCLPYPSSYVPIDYLLNFKSKYADELDRLHLAQYEVFKAISNFDNPDKRAVAEIYEITKFDAAITDYKKAFAARFPDYSLKTLIMDIKNNKSNFVESGAAIADFMTTGFSFSGLLSLSKSFLSCYSSKQKVHSTMIEASQFHYISSAINQGVILQDIKSPPI